MLKYTSVKMSFKKLFTVYLTIHCFDKKESFDMFNDMLLSLLYNYLININFIRTDILMNIKIAVNKVTS